MEQPTVATPSQAVIGMQAAWTLVRALLGGTDAMRAAGESYLPKWPAEDGDSYAARKATAVLFPAYQRTVTTLAGKPFSKPLSLGEDVPEVIKGYTENIDLEGRNLHTFTADVMEAALGYGLGLILVDFPTRPDGINTLADERRAGLRPYFVQIHPWQLIGWRAGRVKGQWELQQLRFMECVEEQSGDFGTVEVDQVRVLEPGKWSTYRKDDKGNWLQHGAGVTTLNRIPLAVAYGQRTGFMCAKPPLLEMAHLNVAHWQSASDQQTVLHVARVPILAAIGVEEEFSLVVGAQTAVCLPTNADLKFVEHTGAAIEAGAKDLKDLEERMRQAGAELLVIDNKLTATQVSSENAVGMCALQRIGESVEDATDQALQFMAEWIGVPEGGHVTVFKDYAAANLSDASTQMIKDWVAAGLLSKEAAFHELQRRGAISADLTWEDVKDQIDMEGPALGEMGGMDMEEAASQLDDAIALHQKHMNGTAPTTGPDGEKSQMLMMQQMKAARAALGGGSDNGDPSGGMGGM